MKTKLHRRLSFHSMLRGSVSAGALIGLACAWPNAARAQDNNGLTGTFSASEASPAQRSGRAGAPKANSYQFMKGAT